MSIDRSLAQSPPILASLLVCCGSGILMSLAAAPLNWWWLAWVALTPLWVIAIASRRGVLPAFAWGVGYHGTTLFWITGLHPLTWLGVPWAASVAIALFCWSFITLWGTATTVLWFWAMQQAVSRVKLFFPHPVFGLLQRVLVGTALWCGLEVLLNLTPLSWTSLAFTQSPGNLVILHLGRLSGAIGVTAAIVAVNGLWAEAWISYHQRNKKLHPERSTERQKGRVPNSLVTIALLLLISAHAIGFALYHQPLADVEASALKVGIIQGNIPTREKLSEAGVQRAIDRYVSGYNALAAQGVAAVLTPEGALPFLWHQAQNPFYQAVLNKQVAAWLGIFVAENGRITQSLLSIASNGAIVGRYNKIKLVPLGEYIPFQETLGRLISRLSPIEANMLPGRTDQRFDTPWGRAIASICYESVFPELFRAQAAAGGQFILTASNLDPYGEALMAQHQAHDLMRAIEIDRWAVRATNTGYSGIIDPHGHILWRSQPKQYQIHSSTVYRRQTQTLYSRWGDWLTPLLIAVAAALLVIQALITRQARQPR